MSERQLRRLAALLVLTPACAYSYPALEPLACDQGACSGVTPSYAHIAYLKASNTGAGDAFGHSVALSADGSTLAVGAFHEASDGSMPSNDAAAAAGAVYVYTRNGEVWSQQAYLKASTPKPGDLFGSSVALSGNGSILAIGAPLADGSGTPHLGAVYVFSRVGSLWGQAEQLQDDTAGSGAGFGYSVALSDDGLRLAIGAPDVAVGDSAPKQLSAGEAWLFQPFGNSWGGGNTVSNSITADPATAGDRFGTSVALSADGLTMAISASPVDSAATNVGKAYILTDNGRSWTIQADANDHPVGAFGSSVALSADGVTLAVGTSRKDGASGQGAGGAYLFALSGEDWVQQAYIEPAHLSSGDQFGGSVALAANGTILAVGAMSQDSGARGVGSDLTDSSAPDSGAVYLFKHSGMAWVPAVSAKALNTGAGDAFGASIALSADGSTLAVGATGEDSNATGTKGDPANDAAPDAGAAYVFD